MIKIIVLSVMSTLTLIVFIFSMFLNNILGAFGLVSTSIGTLKSLKDSKQIVEKMKKRYKQKKLNASKKFIRNSTVRISGVAVGGFTIVGGAALVAGFEAYDYCEDKEEINKNENILYKTNNDFDYSECLNEAKKETGMLVVSVKEGVVSAVKKSWESTKSFSSDSLDSVSSIGFDALNSVKSMSLE